MILALDAMPPSPWKNGGGLTREIAADPPSSGLDEFHWRLSLADIQPGAFDFSRFPGVERHTLVLGPGLSLAPPGAPRSALRAVAPLSSLRLEGEEAWQAVLKGAPIQAFNLMLRRGQASGAVAAYTTPARLPGARVMRALCCTQGRARMRIGADALELPAGSVALLRGAQAEAEAVLEPLLPNTLVLGATVDLPSGPDASPGAGRTPSPLA